MRGKNWHKRKEHDEDVWAKAKAKLAEASSSDRAATYMQQNAIIEDELTACRHSIGEVKKDHSQQGPARI